MSKIVDRLNTITKTLNSQNLAQHAYKKFVELTPVKTGNARKNTRLTGTTIIADYAYGDVLDKGRGIRDGQMRGSEQAPVGMTKPTIEDLRQYIYAQTGINVKGL